MPMPFTTCLLVAALIVGLKVSSAAGTAVAVFLAVVELVLPALWALVDDDANSR